MSMRLMTGKCQLQRVRIATWKLTGLCERCVLDAFIVMLVIDPSV